MSGAPLAIPGQARVINIPSGDEIEMICTLFDVSNRDSSIADTVIALEKLRKKGKDTADIGKNPTEAYLSGIISLDEVQSYYHPNIGNIDKQWEFRQCLIRHRELDKEGQLQLLSALNRGHTSYIESEKSREIKGVDYELDNFLVGIALVGLTDIDITQDFSGSDLLYYLILGILYPGFLRSQPFGFQKKFFELFFANLSPSQKIQSSDQKSELWKYLEQYFGDLGALNPHRPKPKISIDTATFSGNSLSILSQPVLPEGLPTEEELSEVLGIFGCESRLGDTIVFRNHLYTYGNLGDQVNERDGLTALEGCDVRSVALSCISGSIYEGMSGIQKLGVGLRDSISLNSAFDKIFLHVLPNVHKKSGQIPTINYFLQALATEGKLEREDFGLELVYMIIAISIGNFHKSVVKESGILDTEKIKEIFITCILHPLYLQKTNSQEQKSFFEYFFQIIGDDVLRENQFLREYLTKYFGSIDIVSGKLISVLKADISDPSRVEIEIPDDTLKHIRTLIELLNISERENGVSHALAAFSDYRDNPDVETSNKGTTAGSIIPLYISGGLDPKSYDGHYDLMNIEGDLKDQSPGIAILMSHKLSSADQKHYIRRAQGFVVGDEKADDGIVSEIQATEYAILLMKISRIILEEHISQLGFFSELSVVLLLDRKYILNTHEYEQDNFFYMWFESERTNPELNNPKSKIWSYLRRFFGKIPRVKTEFDKAKKGKFLPIENPCPVDNDTTNKAPVIELPQISAENTRIVRNKNTYTLSCDLDVPQGAYFVVGIGRKTKGGLKEISLSTYTEITDIELDVSPRQGVVVGFHTSSSINTGVLRSYPDRFMELGIPFPRQERKKSGSGKKGNNGTSDGLHTNTDTTPDDSLQETGPDQSILEVGVLLTLQDGIDSEVTGGDGITEIQLNRSKDFCLACTESGVKISSNTIIFDVSQTPTKLVSFLGIAGFCISDPDLQTELDKITQRQKSQYLELLQEKKQRDIHASLEKIPAFPKKYRDAISFFRACNSTDLIVPKIKTPQGEEVPGPIWGLPIPGPIKASIDKEMKERGFSVIFKNGNIIIQHVDSNDKVIFDSFSSKRASDMTIQPGSTPNDKNKAIARYLLEYVLAIIVYSYYKNTRSKAKEQTEINNRKATREGVLKDTKTRLDNDEADFITGWDPEGRKNIGWYKASITDKNILGKRGFLQIGNANLTDSKREELYNEIYAQMFESKSTYLLDYFFERIRATHGFNAEFASIGEDKGAAIVRSLDVKGDWFSQKRQICIELFNRLREAKVSIVLMEPISFGYNELLGN